MSTTTLGRLSKMNNAVRQSGPGWTAARYLAVGALGTLLDVGTFTLLHTGLALPAVAANLLSYSLGMLNNFILHRRWTFASRPAKQTRRQLAQFVTVSLSGLALNTTLVVLLSAVLAPLAPATDASLLAKLCATGVGLLWNFSINNFWTFRLIGERGPHA